MMDLKARLAEAARDTLWGWWDAKPITKPSSTSTAASKKAAEAGTQQSTQNAPAEAPCMGDAAWKCRIPMLAEVLSMYLGCSSAPVKVRLSLI